MAERGDECVSQCVQRLQLGDSRKSSKSSERPKSGPWYHVGLVSPVAPGVAGMASVTVRTHLGRCVSLTAEGRPLTQLQRAQLDLFSFNGNRVRL